MTSSSLPIPATRFRLTYRRTGLLAALALQVLVSGCWPGSDDSASKDTKMAPTASTPTAAGPAVAASTPAPAASPAAAAPQSEGPVVAKVNGVEIREGDIKLAEEDIGEQITQVPPESKREYLVTYVGDMILLTQAAEAKKIGESNEFKQQLEFTRKKLLMAKLLDSEAKAASTESAMRKIYDDARTRWCPNLRMPRSSWKRASFRTR